jgi:hypothetical protein
MSRDVVLPPIRCSIAERDEWRRAAAVRGMTLSEFVRFSVSHTAKGRRSIPEIDASGRIYWRQPSEMRAR